MRSSRVKLLLGALLVVILLFSTVNAHGGHGGHSHAHADDLEEDESTPPAEESTPVKSVELPTFTVHQSNCLIIANSIAYDAKRCFH